MPSQSIDQDKLFDAVVNEGINVFGDAVKHYHSETFYAFCLCVDNDVTGVFPAANTHEGITRIQQGKYTFKWDPAEWGVISECRLRATSCRPLQIIIVTSNVSGERLVFSQWTQMCRKNILSAKLLLYF